jgi:hypothetical protein
MDVVEKFTSSDIRTRLRNYYGSQEWALLFEVADATGAGNTRSADAIAMNTWPSRGLAVHGIEIKVSRPDWLHELKRPAKAQTIARYCDYWWLAAPEEIVKHGEVPDAWGHLAPTGNAMRIIKRAAKNDAPLPLDRLFVASLLRNAGRIDEGELRAKVLMTTEAARQDIERQVKEQVDFKTRRLKELSEAVEKFEKDSGLNIANGWSGYDLGRRVKLADALSLIGHRKIKDVSNHLRQKADDIDRALEEAGLAQLALDETSKTLV